MCTFAHGYKFCGKTKIIIKGRILQMEAALFLSYQKKFYRIVIIWNLLVDLCPVTIIRNNFNN